MEHRNVYFDNNATTPLHPGVKEALIEGLEIFGNPSSMHGFGREAREKIEEAREKVASLPGQRSVCAYTELPLTVNGPHTDPNDGARVVP